MKKRIKQMGVWGVITPQKKRVITPQKKGVWGME